MQTRLHAWQYNSDYVKSFVLSVHQKGRFLCELRCVEILEAEVVGISQEVNKFLEAISLKTSMQYHPNSESLRKDMIFHSNHIQPFSLLNWH